MLNEVSMAKVIITRHNITCVTETLDTAAVSEELAVEASRYESHSAPQQNAAGRRSRRCCAGEEEQNRKPT